MINRKILYGYQIRDGALEIVPEEQQTIRMAFTLYIAGTSYQAVADALNHQNIPYCPEAPLWDKHKVKRLLENPRYTGKDGFPAAVDADTFQAARKKAEEKNALRQPRGGKSPIARLTPYFRCTCGGKLIRIGGKWLDSSELHLKCGSCGSTITTDTDTVLTEANRQIYAHEHPKQPA